MIKSLQKRFVFAAMIAVSVLLLFLLGAVNIANIFMERANIDERLLLIASTEEEPQNFTMENGFPSRFGVKPKDEQDILLSSTYFVVRYDPSGSMVYMDTGHIASLSEDELKELANDVFDSNQTRGRIGQFQYLVQSSEHELGTMIIFFDTTDEVYSCVRVLFISLAAGIICWMFMLVLLIVLSKKAIHPIAESIERQKRFVTNAGHEIKTPLAIIQSNADALELYQGETKWSKNIKQQTVRLNGLMKNLLILARMDEKKDNAVFGQIPLSSMLQQIADNFSEPMHSRGLSVKKDIQPDIEIEADQELITQLFSILFDNAVKYARSDTDIELSLGREGRNIIFQISNLCECLPNVPQEQLFERFYRADEARTQKSGGYGIGLSAAREIAAVNKGEIKAHYDSSDRISFVVKFRSIS